MMAVEQSKQSVTADNGASQQAQHAQEAQEAQEAQQAQQAQELQAQQTKSPEPLPSREQEREITTAEAPMYSSPLSLLSRMADEMDRVFQELGFPRTSALFSPLTQLARAQMLAAPTWAPAIEVFQRGGELIVRVDLPGTDIDDIDIDVTDNVLTVEGTRVDEHEEERAGVYRTERRYGAFYRAIALPDGVNTDDITASFENGVLEVAMKAPSQQVSRKVDIKKVGKSSKAEAPQDIPENPESPAKPGQA